MNIPGSSSAHNEHVRSLTSAEAREQIQARIEVLRQAGGVFVDAVRATRMPMALTDPSLPGDPIIFVNQSFLDLSGYSMEEVLGQQPHFMNGAETDPADSERFNCILAADRDGVVETVQYDKRGRRFVATVLLSAFKGEDGRTLHHFFSWADVTRRVQAEEASAGLRKTNAELRESEARHALLIGSWAQAVWETDAQGVVVVDSPSWRAYTGQTLQQRLGYGWVDAIHPDDRAYAERQWREAIETRSLVNAEFRLRAPRGGWRWTNVRAAPVLDEEGHIEKWAGMNIDIDASKQAQAALRDSEARYRTLFESIDEGYLLGKVVFDDQGQAIDIEFLEANPAAIRLAGRDFTGQRMRDIDPHYEEFWYEAYGKVVLTGESVRAEHYAKPHGRWFDFQLSKVGPGDSRLVASVFRDVTERKRTEQALRESGRRQAFLLKLADALRPLSDTAQIQETSTTLLRKHLQANSDTDATLIEECAERTLSAVERARAESALRDSEERLRGFGDASQDILWIRDAQSLAWTYLTPAFESIYGMSREQAMQGANLASWLALVVPQDRSHAKAMIEEVLSGHRVTLEYRIQRPSDGEIRWLRDTDFPIRSVSGQITSVAGIGQDVTMVKLAEDRLRTSEERLRSAAKIAKFGLWDWNIVTDEVAWSDEHFTLQGYDVGEIKPSYQAWIDRVHPEDRAATEFALSQAMDRRTEFVHEFRTRHRDGTVHWLSARGRFYYDEDGFALRMVGAMLDTTERRDWEERQKVLVAELQHRTFNLMGMVNSTAEATLRSSISLEDFGAKFRDRIAALARVQRLLSRLSEDDRVAFDELLRSELDAVGAQEQGERLVLEGPRHVALRSRTVQTLAMAIHELVTNAVKYGALKQAGAKLAVRWKMVTGQAGSVLHVDWRESGVSMPHLPSGGQGTGQGRALIEKALPYQLQATTTYELTADGVHCTIALPVSALKGVTQAGAPTSSGA